MGKLEPLKEIQVTKEDVLGAIEDYVHFNGLNTNFLILKWTHEEIPPAASRKFKECFSDEKIAVASIQPIQKDLVSTFDFQKLKNQVGPIRNPQISCINLHLVIDFASEIRSRFGTRVSLADISDYLNIYGFSTTQIPLGIKNRLEKNTTETNDFAAVRDSNSYFSKIEQTLKYSSENFLTEFVQQIEGVSKKIILDLSGLPRIMNGTSRVSFGLLKEINSQIFSGQFNVEALAIVPREILEELREKFSSIKFESDFPAEDVKFDLGFSITPVTSLKTCFEMSLRSAKWIVLHLDLIALRSYTHLSQQPSALEAFRFIHTYADVVIYISDFSAIDAENYLQEEPKAEKFVSLLGLPEEFLESTNSNYETLERNGKILVLGNDEPHKQVGRVVKKLLETGKSVISISKQPSLDLKHSVIAPGTLTETELTNLMEVSDLIIFPSIYEGFGLPLVEAASIGRPVVVWDTAINHEIIKKFELTNIFLCSSLTELGDIVQSIQQSTLPRKVSIPSLSQFNLDVVSKMASLINSDLEVDFAQMRWSAMRLIGATFEESERLRTSHLNHQKLSPLGKVIRKIGNKLLSLSEANR